MDSSKVRQQKSVFNTNKLARRRKLVFRHKLFKTIDLACRHQQDCDKCLQIYNGIRNVVKDGYHKHEDTSQPPPRKLGKRDIYGKLLTEKENKDNVREILMPFCKRDKHGKNEAMKEDKI